MMKFVQKTFSWSAITSSHNLMVLLVFILGLFNFFWGEKVPVNGGLGWDGVTYAHLASHLDSIISEDQLSNYYAQRILPSAIVRSIISLAKVPITDINIIRTFEIYNLTLLIGACFIWKKISNNFLLSLSGRWIGFGGIFFNFATSKQAFYSPVLTDITALFLGLLMLLFYIEKRSIFLCLITIIGSFCWPVVSICGALLLIFQRSELPKKTINLTLEYFKTRFLSFSITSKIAIFSILGFPFVGYAVLKVIAPVSVGACNVFNKGLNAFVNIAQSNALQYLEREINNDSCGFVRQVLTALPSIYFLLIGLIILAGSKSFFYSIFSNLQKIKFHIFILAIAAIFIPFFIIKILSNSNVRNPSSLIYLIRWSLFPPEGKFFLPIISLGVFWGPTVLLIMLSFEKFCAQARRLGPGVVFMIAISFILGMCNEPRFITLSWPFIVLSMVLGIEGTAINRHFKYTLILLTILFAQFFLKFNYSPWLGGDYEGLLNFPKQLYFMHFGFWMSWIPFLFQFIALSLSFLLLNYIKKR